MRKLSLAAFLIVVALVAVLGEPLFQAKLRLAAWLNWLPAELSGTAALRQEITALKNENAALRVKLLEQQIETKPLIKVYSSYPFNSRGEIIIAAGEDQGLKSGDLAVINGNLLVGKVTKVFKSSSVVSTIFDPSWKMPVRIGQGEVDALMEGGNELTLTLIPKEASINEGELVITAGKDFPYGLGVGTIKNIRESTGGVFREATLEPLFQLKELRNVAIYH
jgi:rod shape-determining protein MreC